MDLKLRFNQQDIAQSLTQPLVDMECRVLTLEGNLLDGTPIRGNDVIRIQLGTPKDSPGDDAVANTLALGQNTPNPFNPLTTISYSLPDQMHARLAMFDALGREVAILLDDVQDPGAHMISWNGTDASGNPLPSGVYFYRLAAGDRTMMKKMIITR